MERDSRGQIILKVYLDNTEERTAEVPVTPDTTCADVIECCKEAGEEQCHLAELWRGCERVIAPDERPFEILQQWGIHRDEVVFFLRHETAAVLNNMQGRRIHKKNGLVEGSHSNSNMLPTGVDLTLSELQEMAARQQQQIETQQQILVAKEQRLKFLKQQEMRHHQIASENERLRKLREKVESQELKLKKLRALRGQVDQHKSNNVNFTSELEAIRGLFNEKEKELAVAVAKVEELTKQLEKVQRGNMHGNSSVLNTPAMMELEKLRKELAMRNKVNEQQNVKLNSTRQVLVLKKDEVTMMDKRIAELQARLQKKRAMQQEQRNNLANQKRVASGSVSPQRSQSSNIAAVEPYIKHAPKDVSKDDMFSNQDLKAGFSLGKSDPKYQTLPYNTKFPIGDVGKKPEREQVNGNDNYHPEKPVSYSNTQSGVKVPSPNNNSQQIQNKEMKTNLPANFVTSADNMVTVNAAQEVIQTFAPQDAQVKNRYSFTVKAPTCFANFAPRPFGSTYSTALITNRNNAITTTVSNSQAVSSAFTQHGESNGQVPTVIVTGTSSTTGKDEMDSSVQTSMQQPLTVFITGSMTVSGPVSPQICTSSKGGPPIYKVSSRPTPLIQPQQTEVPVSPPQSPNNNNNIPDRVTVTPPRGPITSTPITQIQQINTPQTTFVDTPTSSNADNRPVPGQFTVTNSTKVSLSERQTLEVEPAVEPGQTAALLVQSEPENVPVAVLSSSSSDPHSAKEALDTSPNAVSSALSVLMGSTTATTTTRPTYRYAPKSVIANTYMRKMGSSAIDQYRKNMAALYKDFYPHGDAVTNTETASSTADTSFPDPPHNTPVNSPSPVKQENIHNQNTDSQIPENSGRPEPPPYPGNTRGLSPHKTAPPPYPGPRALRRRLSTDDADLTSQTEQSSESSMQPGTRVSPQQEESPTKDAKSVVVMRVKKPTLKSKDSIKTVSRRVSFDPLALLLDASLEGELELVKRTAAEVPDPSAANDEGITALHNAICAGHYDIVKFLVEFGCDANAPDSDGWTPLHCAASCNNLPMVKFLVEHGACIFATTISDQETAAEKCEEDEDGYDGCSEYLYSIQEKLGILNNGLVYALFDYIAQNNDELEFHINDQLTVLRKGDDHERDWWWTRHKDREGYIPRNLLGLYPRVLPKKEGS